MKYNDFYSVILNWNWLNNRKVKCDFSNFILSDFLLYNDVYFCCFARNSFSGKISIVEVLCVCGGGEINKSFFDRKFVFYRLYFSEVIFRKRRAKYFHPLLIRLFFWIAVCWSLEQNGLGYDEIRNKSFRSIVILYTTAVRFMMVCLCV